MSESRLFHKVEDCYAILRVRGVFKQVDIYQREQFLYAKAVGGFVRLMSHTHTSVPHISHIDLIGSVVIEVTSGGYLKLVGEAP